MKKYFTSYVVYLLVLISSFNAFSKTNTFDTTAHTCDHYCYDNTETATDNVTYPWRDVATANVPRWEGASAVVNGKMYVFTGFNTVSALTTSTTEVYDPLKNTWTPLADMPNAITHEGIAVDGDNVLFAGGFHDNHGLSNSFLIYNTTNNTWSTGPSLPENFGSNGMARVGRKLYVFGGLMEDHQTDIGHHFVLDMDNMSAGWKKAAPLPDPRNHHAVVTSRGKVYAIGGQYGHDGTITYSKSLHVYDPSSDTWERLADLPLGRSHFEPGTFVLDGKIYITGGRGANGKIFNNITQYDIETNTWTELDPLPYNIMAPAAKVIDTLLIVSHGSLNATDNPQASARVRYQPRAPIYKLGFWPSALNLSVPKDGSVSGESVLWTISGNANYTINGMPAWLSVNSISSSTDANGKLVKFTANATGKLPGIYSAILTASAPGYTPITIEIKMNVVSKNGRFLYLYGTLPPGIHDMKLSDTGSKGLSQFNKAITDVGFDTEEFRDSAVVLTAALLKNYKVVFLGSNNRRFTIDEQIAVKNWVNDGGGLIAWCDAGFGEAVGGIDNSFGRDSDNDIVQQFGMNFLHDNGVPTFQISQWKFDHYLNDFNKDGGITIEAEGVSPIRSTSPAMVLATLPPGAQRLNALDGPLLENDAAVSIAEIGNGRVIGIFDRNGFWNNGGGSSLVMFDNKEFAQRFAIWASGNKNPTANAGADKTLSLLPINEVKLPSTYSDSDGSIVSFLWTQKSGPSAIMTGDTSAILTLSNLIPGTYVFQFRAIDDDMAAGIDEITLVVTKPPATASLRINSGGGSYTDSSGKNYMADNYFTQGTQDSNLSITDIIGTTEDGLYKNSRISNVGGSFFYNLPLAAGNYNVTLYFAETYFGAPGGSPSENKIGKRIFNVKMENSTKLSNFDLIAEAGTMKALTKLFYITVTDGVLNIEFAAVVYKSIVSAIEVTAAVEPPIVNIIAPLNNTSFKAPIDIDLVASATDNDGTVTKIIFYQGSTIIKEDTSSPFTYKWVQPAPGNYSITAQAFDNTNMNSTSSPINIIVNPSDQIIFAQITDPLNNAQFNEPANFNINAKATGSGVGEPAFMKIKCTDNAYRKLKFGYDLKTIYNPLKSVTTGGNNAIEITLKTFSDNVNWSKIQIRPQGNATAPVVIGNYLPTGGVGNSWTKITIPLSEFNSSIDFSQVSFIELPYSASAGTFEIGISEIKFTGGTSPFVWFGASKTNNINDGLGNAGQLLAQLMPPTASGLGISKVEFYKNNVKLGEDTLSPYSYSCSNVPAGNYTLIAKAIGNDNSINASSPINIIVKGSNAPPSVNISSPVSGTNFIAPTDVMITANASDTDGNIKKIIFYSENIKIGEDSISPYAFSWKNVLAGNYNLTVIATDNKGASTNSSVVNIVVKNPVNPVTIHLTEPANNAQYSNNASIPLKAIVNGSGNGEPPYLRIQCPDNAFRKLKFGYDPVKIFDVYQNVIAGGNNTVEITLKNFGSAINWNKVQIRPLGNTTNPVVIGNYIGAATSLANGWMKVSIPLSAFNSGVDFSQLSYMELPYSSAAGIFDMAISEVRFTGGTSPFLWFGGVKKNNMHDGKGGGGQLIALLVSQPPSVLTVDFFENNTKVHETISSPYEVTLINVPSGNYIYKAQATLSDNTTIVSDNVTVIVGGANNGRIANENSPEEQPDNIQVYPNPLQDIVTVQFYGKRIAGNVSLTLYDERGKVYKLGSKNLNEGRTISLDLTSLNLSPGKYYLMVESDAVGRCRKGFTCYGNEKIQLIKFLR